MDSRAVRSFRVFVLSVAVLAVVLGVVAIVLPRPGLVVVALLFGVYLIVAGVMRVTAAAMGHGTHPGWRWSSVVIGVVTAVAGLVCLLDPAVPLAVLAVLAGVGLVLEGVAAFVGAVVGHPGSSRVPAVTSGSLSVVGGVVVLLAPGLALAAFVVLAGVVFLVAGLAALLLLPPRAAVRG
jgi:uncharacterized membrane protein HdeD (DUF308 family)